MQRGLLVGMGAGDVLVEGDAEARFGGRDDVAILPSHGRDQEFGVEALPSLDALEDQEVG